jgi:cation-transporting ATPase I
VSIAVAAVPEGLPLVATVAQASAARRLSRRGVLVRSSRTLEAFGRVDTVCFDKTGTLTQGRPAVVRLAAVDADLEDADSLARRAIVAGRACPSDDAHGITTLPHATDHAVLEAAARVGDSLDGWGPAKGDAVRDEPRLRRLARP